MKIALLEPYFGGSHQRWAQELQAHSKHEIAILSLPARHWKWRMHGAAITLANHFLSKKENPDLIIATDMLDLSLFLSLTRSATRHIPCLLYFHENQLTYPPSPSDTDATTGRDRHYGFINYQSALVADAVLFNSKYHKTDFLASLRPFLQAFPDFKNVETIKIIEEKSKVIPVGVEQVPAKFTRERRQANDVPCLLWNHRWEYDKNPESFFRILLNIKKKGIPFQLRVLGKSGPKAPEVFSWAQSELASEITHFGYCETKNQYWSQLASCDIIHVTSQQDFFGISVVEAIGAGVTPLLPNRLAYPEHIPKHYHDDLLYADEDELCLKLENLLEYNKPFPGLVDFSAKYLWENIIETYDQHFEKHASPTKQQPL